MKLRIDFWVTLIFCFATVRLTEAQVLIFEDDFNHKVLDSVKWDTEITDPSFGTVAIVDHQLRSTAYGNCTVTYNAYAVAKPIALPVGWRSVTLSGKWCVSSASTGEFNIKLYDADNPGSYVLAAYATWTDHAWNHFRAIDSNECHEFTARAIPSTYKSFELKITPTGWTFTEEGVEVLADVATTHMDDISNMQFRIGCCDWSGEPVEIVYFDDIVVVAEVSLGDICQAPIVVESIPFVDDANSCDFSDDYDSMCDGASSGSPDVVYLFTPIADTVVNISLCDSLYDTKLYVYKDLCSESNLSACSRNDCTNPQSQPITSVLKDLSLRGGHDYFIVVDGENDQCGNYILEITEGDPMPTCGDNAMFCQPAGGPYDSFYSILSDQAYDDGPDPELRHIDKYTGVDPNVTQIRWWGFNLIWDEDQQQWLPCTKDPDCEIYNIRFYQNDGDHPGSQVLSFDVNARKFNTGLEYGSYGQLYEYTASLPAKVIPAPSGWISIKATACSWCVFFWVASPVGDGYFINWEGGSYYWDYHNLSFCLYNLADQSSNPCPCVGARQLPRQPELFWSYDGFAPVSYDVYLGNDDWPNLNLIASDLTEPNCSVTQLLNINSSYVWRVVAKNNRDETWGPLWDFTTRSIIGDLSYNNEVTLSDFAIFTSQWLDPNCHGCNDFCQGADLNYDNEITITDLYLLSRHWLDGTSGAPPINDLCENAYAIILGQYDGNTTNATGTDITSCGSEDSLDVWYSFTAESAETYKITIYDPVHISTNCTVAVLDECNGTELGCAVPGGSLNTTELEMSLVSDKTYLIRVAAIDGQTESFRLYLEIISP